MLMLEAKMENLDHPQAFDELDKEGMLNNITELPDQIEQAWQELEKFIIPAIYIKVKNVVILGMGGSGVGGSLGQILTQTTSRIPITVIKDYNLPKFVSSDTLVIGVSYSGETEETLTAFAEAGKRQAKLIGIAIGGSLVPMASKFRCPVYQFNYGSQPRAALGFLYTGILGIFNKLGIIELTQNDIKEAVVLMKGLREKIKPEAPIYQNDAKKLAQRIFGNLPIIIGSSILAPVAYRWRCQMNENAKNIACDLTLPELCHNWLSGLHFPAELKKTLLIIILQSKYDHPRNRLKQNIISQIFKKQGIASELIYMQPSGSPLSEQLLSIYFGDYVSYYLAMLNNVNPTTIEEVHFLKKQLSNNE